jgi:hypothetical protein
MTAHTDSIPRAPAEEIARLMPPPTCDPANDAGGELSKAQPQDTERAAPGLVKRFLHNLMVTLGAWSA